MVFTKLQSLDGLKMKASHHRNVFLEGNLFASHQFDLFSTDRDV